MLAQKLMLPGATPVQIDGLLSADKLGDSGGQITLGSILSSAITYILPIAGIGLLIMILVAGFTLLTSAGDTKAMEKGKQTLTYGIVGFLIIFLAYWITQLLGIAFGFNSISTIFK